MKKKLKDFGGIDTVLLNVAHQRQGLPKRKVNLESEQLVKKMVFENEIEFLDRSLRYKNRRLLARGKLQLHLGRVCSSIVLLIERVSR